MFEHLHVTMNLRVHPLARFERVVIVCSLGWQATQRCFEIGGERTALGSFHSDCHQFRCLPFLLGGFWLVRII